MPDTTGVGMNDITIKPGFLIVLCLTLSLAGCVNVAQKNAMLLQAATTGNNAEVTRLLNEHANISARNFYGDTPLHLAIRNNHADTAELLIERGANVNARGELEDTPLHVSIYQGETKVSTLLTQHGADESLRNRYGLTPQDMQGVPAIQSTIVNAANLLTTDGEWTDADQGLTLYNNLEAQPQNVVINSLVLEILNNDSLRLRVLILAIKLGIPNSEGKLVDILMEFGDKSMTEDYLNSGSDALANGGRQWATEHGYNILTGNGSHRAGWGQF